MGALQPGFGAEVDLILELPAVFLEQVVCFQFVCRSEHHGALIIFEKSFIGYLGQFKNQPLEEVVGFVRETLRIKRQEVFPLLDVPGLVGLELANDLDRTKDQHSHKKQRGKIAAQKTHGGYYVNGREKGKQGVRAKPIKKLQKNGVL
jgi:hypothetical protein